MEEVSLTQKSIKSKLLATSIVAGACSAFVIPAVMVAPAVAQDYTSGAIEGNVVNTDGEAIAGATVVVTSDAQGFSRTSTSDQTGRFRFGSLPQGAYSVQVTAPGYDALTEGTLNASASSTASYTLELLEEGARLDTVTVTGVQQNLSFSGQTQGLNLDIEEIQKDLPIGRDLTSVTLLAPSTSQGDGAFGNLSAIAGSSVAENAYYLNGLNLTNFDTYLGGSRVPFEFYKSVEVKTAAYPAEYGRATGGILNAVSKSGSNEFMAELHLNWEPDSLRDDAPDTYLARNELDERDDFSAVIEVGGPILKDRLFFYGLVELRDIETKNAGILSGIQNVDTSDDPFYGFKLDGFITDNNQVEFTYIDTSRETVRQTYAYDPIADEIGAAGGSTIFDDGGESWVAKYTGTWTDWLTFSAAYGENNDQAEVLAGEAAPYIQDSRSGIGGQLRGPQGTLSQTQPRDLFREFYRADLDVRFSALGDHHVRLGYDRENLDFQRFSNRTGPDNIAYIYRTAVDADPRANGPGGVPVGTEYVELNFFQSGGAFTAENEAFYIQDEWDVTDRLTLNLGLRSDSFANFGADGSQYIDFSNEIGERLGFTYDPIGDGRSKVYGNFGRYYLPVASNTAFRFGGGELFFREYWTFTNDPTQAGTPVLDTQIVNWEGANPCPQGLAGSAGTDGCAVTGDGTVPDLPSQVSNNLKATEQEEWVLGYEFQYNDLWTLNTSFVYRDLITTAEDGAIDSGVLELCEAEGIDGCEDIFNGFHQYVIFNPGEPIETTLIDPLPGETELRQVTLSPQQLGYPKAKRTYSALEFSFDRAFDGVWGLRGSYTLSESKGNSEGYVKSDNGQADAGITQDFDTPNLMDGAYGLLPNHRAHTFKLFGSYQVTDDFLIGANGILQSPRQYGCIGLHPEGYDPAAGQFDPAQLYGAAAFYCDGELTPRGSQFEGEWLKNIDVSFRYNVPLDLPTNIVLRADIFNVFGFESATDFDEFGDEGNGDRNPFYQQITAYQQPRTVRLGLDIEF
jgi:hypothetical protein